MSTTPPPNPTGSDDAAASAAKREGGANKRGHERQYLGLEGATAFEHAESELPQESIPCEVFDISRSGVGIRCRKMMYAGRRVFVLLATADGAPPRVLYGEIRYARYAERGMYHVGVRFLPIPNSHGLKDWLQEQGAARKRHAA